jgi:hypothetical protein
MIKSRHILCFEDFYYDDSDVLNEASQNTIARLQNQKGNYAKKLGVLKRKQQESAELASKIKEKESQTKNQMTQKIYSARAMEEKMRQELYGYRLQALEQALKIVDQKLTIVNLRLQSKSQRDAK